jgi:hypothetical protein
MALDLHAYVLVDDIDPATGSAPFQPLVYPSEGVFTVGADYSAGVAGSTGRNDSGGLILQATFGLLGNAGTFDVYLQTAVEDAEPYPPYQSLPPPVGTDAWVDTNPKILGITKPTPGTVRRYQLHITDPIVSKCRLRIVRTLPVGAVATNFPTWSTFWMSDRALALNPAPTP